MFTYTEAKKIATTIRECDLGDFLSQDQLTREKILLILENQIKDQVNQNLKVETKEPEIRIQPNDGYEQSTTTRGYGFNMARAIKTLLKNHPDNNFTIHEVEKTITSSFGVTLNTKCKHNIKQCLNLAVKEGKVTRVSRGVYKWNVGTPTPAKETPSFYKLIKTWFQDHRDRSLTIEDLIEELLKTNYDLLSKIDNKELVKGFATICNHLVDQKVLVRTSTIPEKYRYKTAS